MPKRILMPALAISMTFFLPAFSASSDEITKEEHQQIGNSSQPDVDPNASTGQDPSVVTQEHEQIGNSAQPDVDPNASMGADPSITDQEKAQIPH